MQKTAFQIIDDFYNAAWDLAENLFRLYEHADNPAPQRQISVLEAEDADLPLTPSALAAQFRKYAQPLLDLTGRDIPQDQHLPYMQIEDCLNETVFPALDIIEEDWQALPPNAPHLTAESLSAFREGCSHLRCETELFIIPQAKAMCDDMKPQ